jgi:hypothetical protein
MASHDQPIPNDPVFFRITPELRRCGYYVLAAGPLFASIYFGINFLFQFEPISATIQRSAITLLICMGVALFPFRWAVRIDRQGVARRVLFRWNLFTWEDISSGRIEKRHAFVLVDPARPWWRRKISIGLMGFTNIKQAIAWINARYRLPDPPELPEVVELKYGFRHAAKFDAKGFYYEDAKDIRQYLWNEIVRVHFLRMDPVRRDFWSLEIDLPDRQIALTFVTHQGGTTPNWSGASAEMISTFLERHLPAERIVVDIAGERPLERIDLEKQLAKLQESRRALRWCLSIFGTLLVATLVWMAVDESIAKALIMTGVSAIPIVPVAWFLRSDTKKKTQKIEKQLAEFDASVAASNGKKL